MFTKGVILSCMLSAASAPAVLSASETPSGWTSTENGLVYIDPATGNTAAGLTQIGEDIYYFDESTGTMFTGFVNTPDGRTYYFGEKGEMLRGWRNIDGERYYFLQSDGCMVKDDFVTYKENRYYMDPEGRMVKGLYTVNGVTYYFAESGEMLKGWRDIGDDRYYFLQEDGSMVKNHFVTWKEDQYYLGTDGKVTKGFLTLDGKTYYFSETGKMLKGWRNIGGSRYYFLQKDGAMVQDHFVTWKDKKYYMGPDGKMVTGLMTFDGEDYCFGEKGDMLYGWRNIDGSRYYFLQSDGTMVKDKTVTWNDNKYYLGADGKLVTDRTDFEWKGEHFRIDSDGVMLSASDSMLYLCNNNGSLNRTLGVKENTMCVLPSLENPVNGTFIGWASKAGLQLNLVAPTQVAYEAGDTVQVPGQAKLYSAVFMNDQDTDIEQDEITRPDSGYAGIVFVGDSRLRSIDSSTKQYQNHVNNISFVTRENADLEWLVAEGYGTFVGKVDRLRAENPDKPVAVVFQMGLSELGENANSTDAYVSVLTQIRDALKDRNCRYFFTSLLPLNPVQMQKSGVRKPENPNVQSLRTFNNMMAESLPEDVLYVDLYSWLMAYGYRSDDGLLFSDATNRRILNEVIRRVNREMK